MHKKILVVDDDKDILEAMQLLLENEGYTVLTVSKGEETYQNVLDFKPDIILLDVLMSGVDGRVVCKTLKKDIKMSKPIVMISAHPSAKNDISRYGANDFLEKPFETKELLNTIKKNLN
jgi:DNA-binding response OmpR family regulator